MCPLELPTMEEKLPENWERADNDLGVPYYVDHRDKMTHWDHPLFSKVTGLISSCDSVKYSAYRTAAKIRVLQKILHFDHVRLSVVAGVFEQHGLSANENTSTIECGHIEAILSDIFFVANTEVQAMNGRHFDQNIATELALNLLLNTFDLKRKGSVKVMEVKVLIAILSCGLTDTAIFVHKPKGRGKWAQDRLMECYRFLYFQGGDQGVSEEDFLKWLDSGPRLFIWLTILHRMMAAELVKHHGVRCILCKTSPIVGLRFRCLSCLMHDQCQDCFLHGKTNTKHKLGHPMYEYCLQTTSREDRQAFVKTLKNKVRSSRFRVIQSRNKHDGSIWERRSVTYVDNEQIKGTEVDAEDCVGETQLLIQEMEMTAGEDEGGPNESSGIHGIKAMAAPLPPRYPKEELSSIIGHLEEGHRDLGEQIEGLWLRQDRGGGATGLLGMLCLRGGSMEVVSGTEELVCMQLQGTRVQLEEQVKRLKALQECLQKIQPSLAEGGHQRQCHLESTPMPMNNRIYSMAHPLPRLEDLSPILALRPKAQHEGLTSSEDSVGVILSDVKVESGSPSKVDLGGVGVGRGFSSSSSSASVLTEVFPQDLSTVLMARWRGGMRGFVGSSQVSSPAFLSSSILPSPVHPCPLYRKNPRKQNDAVEVVSDPFVEIQRDLDWVLGELDAMLSFQINEHSSSSNSEEPGESLENQEICRTATQLEDLLAGLIQVVERQKYSENGLTSPKMPKM